MGAALQCCTERQSESGDDFEVVPSVPSQSTPASLNLPQRGADKSESFDAASNGYSTFWFALVTLLAFSFLYLREIAELLMPSSRLKVGAIAVALFAIATVRARASNGVHGVNKTRSVNGHSKIDKLCSMNGHGIARKVKQDVIHINGACTKPPLESAPLTQEEALMVQLVERTVAGLTYAQLRRDKSRCVWLKEADQHSRRSVEVVCFESRDVTRMVLSALACKEPNGAQTAANWLQQMYALRFDHEIDTPRLRYELSPADFQHCRAIHPKAVYGLAKPYGYPIVWDMVSALRLKDMRAAFGSLEVAFEKLLWYDLYLMELIDRYRLRLSSARGGVLLIKGVTILDLGAWSSDLCHPGILRTVQRILLRSGAIWPESIWRVYLINVPWVFFGPWAVLKKSINPVSLAKIRLFFKKSEFLDHLEQDLGIPPSGIPQEHGGQGARLLDLPLTPTAHLDEKERLGSATQK